MGKPSFVNIVPNPHPKTVPVMKLPVSFRHICEVFPELSDMYVGNFIDWAGVGEYNGLYHSYRCVSGAKLTLLDAFRAVERIAKETDELRASSGEIALRFHTLLVDIPKQILEEYEQRCQKRIEWQMVEDMRSFASEEFHGRGCSKNTCSEEYLCAPCRARVALQRMAENVP
jgi:hypothetical protein